MRLLRLKAKHLFSLGEVDISLASRGLVLVTGFSKDEGGSNGAGKSSLANKAIVWTLFGETAGGTKADAVGNRYFAKGSFGEVEFEGFDGQLYRVCRARPANLELYRGGSNISGKTAKDTQEQINLALGCDFKTFIQTSYFGQGRVLGYAALTPKEQKAVLESILPMEEVDRWAKYAEECLKKAEVLKAKLLIDAEAQKRVYQTLEGEISRTKARGIEFEDNRKRAIEQEHQNNALAIKARYKNAREEIQKEIDFLSNQNTDTTALESELAELMASKTDIERKWMQAVESRGQWETRWRYLTDEKAKMEKSTSCPTCLREFDETTVNSVKERLKQHDNLISEASNNFALAQRATAFYHEQKEKVGHKILSVNASIIDIRFIIERQNMAVGELEQLNRKEQDEEAALAAFIERKTNEENPFVAALLDIETRAAEAQVNYVQHMTKVDAATKECEHLAYWKNVYAKDLKLKLFEDACPFLDARVAHHLKRLGNGQIYVSFSTVKRLASGETKEDFNVHVESTTGGKGFDSLSGGEQQMVSFSIGLGLADLAGRSATGRSGVLILDEPFTELDARNSESIVTYLSEEVKNGKDTILLISNDEELKGLVTNRIHVVKEKGITSVAEA